MSTLSSSQAGDFTVFGFTRNFGSLNKQLNIKLGIFPQIIEIGSIGHFFFYTSYGDVAESKEAMVLKLGMLRSVSKSALNAEQLLEQKIVGPCSINANAFSGNGLVVSISKTEPIFSAFQTLMSLPQLYYSLMNDTVICSDVLRCLVSLIPQCEVNEDILPQHYIFRSVYGPSTYIRGVNRLIPGHFMKWKDGDVEIRLVRSLDAVSDEMQLIKNDRQALNLLGESLEGVVGDYTAQVEAKGQGHASLLSGGVDSSILQYYINRKSFQEPLRSLSFAIQVPTFDFEVEYARQASQILNTLHTFVKYSAQDYPGLLTRVIDILSQPPNFETEPSFLALAEFIHTNNWQERHYFTGQGGDTLFGGKDTRKLKGLQIIRKIPYSDYLLRGLGGSLVSMPSLSHMLLKGAEIIASENDPDAYASPSNTVCVYVLEKNWDILQRCFGDQVLRQTLAFRRNLVAQYTNSNHYIDKVYFIDLTTDLWELAVHRNQLFLAYRLEQISPFFDEDIIKAALTFHPDIRYIKGFRYKHLLKRLLYQNTKAPVTHKPKGPSTINEDLVSWMHSGPLRPMVEDIQRPGFMSKADFERLITKPDYFVWTLLTFDLFQKRIIKNRAQIVSQDRKDI
jgi:asparagine synthetase B (glutamine-hydrolysing)